MSTSLPLNHSPSHAFSSLRTVPRGADSVHDCASSGPAPPLSQQALTDTNLAFLPTDERNAAPAAPARHARASPLSPCAARVCRRHAKCADHLRRYTWPGSGLFPSSTPKSLPTSTDALHALADEARRRCRPRLYLNHPAPSTQTPCRVPPRTLALSSDDALLTPPRRMYSASREYAGRPCLRLRVVGCRRGARSRIADNTLTRTALDAAPFSPHREIPDTRCSPRPLTRYQSSCELRFCASSPTPRRACSRRFAPRRRRMTATNSAHSTPASSPRASLPRPTLRAARPARHNEPRPPPALDPKHRAARAASIREPHAARRPAQRPLYRARSPPATPRLGVHARFRLVRPARSCKPAGAQIACSSTNARLPGSAAALVDASPRQLLHPACALPAPPTAPPRAARAGSPANPQVAGLARLRTVALEAPALRRTSVVRALARTLTCRRRRGAGCPPAHTALRAESGLSKDQMRDFSPPSGSNVRLRSSSKCLVFRLAKRGGLCADRNLRLAALRGARSSFDASKRVVLSPNPLGSAYFERHLTFARYLQLIVPLVQLFPQTQR
ncbi:hypothetical protein B0H15DRAFT_958850 [Mycena belliarum]|uniref:Uncharacterized protein n=1 Tax=Mycena belliarum TaxID=1033014 RepID=A0AAD6TQ68_9AGAR|nr:hypothetical protein B0H15DRAFT_958850 [Mycena belliae]